MNRSKGSWSYIAGEKGRNRVRAFEVRASGRILIEFKSHGRKRRIAAGHSDRELAKEQAEELALRLRRPEPDARHELTLAELFENYLREVTPGKGKVKQVHDRTTAGVVLEIVGGGRTASSLTHRDAARFVSERQRKGDRRPRSAPKKQPAKTAGKTVRKTVNQTPPETSARNTGENTGRNTEEHAGEIHREFHGVPAPGEKPPAVRSRVVGYDLQCLMAVLNWGVRGGLLDRNPLQGFRIPRESSPRRPIVTDQQYRALLAVAESVDPLARLGLVLANETGHRIGAIRNLRWSDVELRGAESRIKWRAENDKIHFEHVTPATEELVRELEAARKRRRSIGDGWVLPSPTEHKEPVSRHLVRDWWVRMQKLAKLPEDKGRGWHSLRRKFATELKHAPLKDLCYLGGWKEPQTILKCYQRADEATMQEALKSRRILNG